jgi:hypothetical protein
VLPVRYELDCKYCYKYNVSQPYRLPRPVTGHSFILLLWKTALRVKSYLSLCLCKHLLLPLLFSNSADTTLTRCVIQRCEIWDLLWQKEGWPTLPRNICSIYVPPYEYSVATATRGRSIARRVTSWEPYSYRSKTNRVPRERSWQVSGLCSTPMSHWVVGDYAFYCC